MANDKDINVVRSIISSFSEIAKILGPELTNEDLRPIFDSFLANKNETIRDLALKELPKVVEHLNDSIKMSYIANFHLHTFDETAADKWRIKIKKLEEMGNFFKFYDTEAVFRDFLPFGINLCFDDVILC